ncbi:hypothetical protein FisN_18Lh067 [Fistulifera solaris]|uniref:Uncharacterized protein n=1 Tax=Fistulifera solaris TaxID=1519565 RepID=A0A1Z5KE17_FISSO|nr:hypothetical protein FisN_18Lh067 [Fistulifera solaris]|eukprot:GAX24513.1 hypothetical protein FisN_18Lh067 [Fistulifera solaris]
MTKLVALICLLVSVTTTSAFSIPPAVAKTTALFAVASGDYYRRTLEQARQVAFAPTSSPQEARKYLFEVLHLQTGCSTGFLEDDGVCDNVQEMADLVAHLRVKANEKVLRREVVLLASLMMSASAVTLMAWFMGISHVVPFTPQEWMWAVRDGYLPTLLEQNFKYGGFLVDDPTDYQPFLWTEWGWSLRDGYVPTMMADWFRNGGL